MILEIDVLSLNLDRYNLFKKIKINYSLILSYIYVKRTTRERKSYQFKFLGEIVGT
jgi:hypothetical protein